MSLASLHLENVRNLADVRLDPHERINWLYGENGAGKTSVLEGLHLLARGRSFRAGSVGSLIRDGQERLRVVAERKAPEMIMGIERSRGGWRGRIDGADCGRVSEFALRLPMVVVEPGSHQLVAGGPDVRRNFLDWALFHVEHDYLARWRRYARLLRQRNAALKQGAKESVLDALEPPMAEAADGLDAARGNYVRRLAAAAGEVQKATALRLAELEFHYRPATADAQGHADALRSVRTRDREHGFTSVGPHRADLVLRSAGRLAAPRLSRGQEKLVAFLLKLSELVTLPDQPYRPVLLLDDPVSELDSDHLRRVLQWLQGRSEQVWITAVEPAPESLGALFHVEQGGIRRMV
ncbi:DNA replication/repair protein RecF [Halomonas denitrificans]|nr:DNA replication/repair protein RecF [Halomonas denitrificans]